MAHGEFALIAKEARSHKQKMLADDSAEEDDEDLDEADAGASLSALTATTAGAGVLAVRELTGSSGAAAPAGPEGSGVAGYLLLPMVEQVVTEVGQQWLEIIWANWFASQPDPPESLTALKATLSDASIPLEVKLHSLKNILENPAIEFDQAEMILDSVMALILVLEAKKDLLNGGQSLQKVHNLFETLDKLCSTRAMSELMAAEQIAAWRSQIQELRQRMEWMIRLTSIPRNDAKAFFYTLFKEGFLPDWAKDLIDQGEALYASLTLFLKQQRARLAQLAELPQQLQYLQGYITSFGNAEGIAAKMQVLFTMMQDEVVMEQARPIVKQQAPELASAFKMWHLFSDELQTIDSSEGRLAALLETSLRLTRPEFREKIDLVRQEDDTQLSVAMHGMLSQAGEYLKPDAAMTKMVNGMVLVLKGKMAWIAFAREELGALNVWQLARETVNQTVVVPLKAIYTVIKVGLGLGSTFFWGLAETPWSEIPTKALGALLEGIKNPNAEFLSATKGLPLVGPALEAGIQELSHILKADNWLEALAKRAREYVRDNPLTIVVEKLIKIGVVWQVWQACKYQDDADKRRIAITQAQGKLQSVLNVFPEARFQGMFDMLGWLPVLRGVLEVSGDLPPMTQTENRLAWGEQLMKQLSAPEAAKHPGKVKQLKDDLMAKMGPLAGGMSAALGTGLQRAIAGEKGVASENTAPGQAQEALPLLDVLLDSDQERGLYQPLPRMDVGPVKDSSTVAAPPAVIAAPAPSTSRLPSFLSGGLGKVTAGLTQAGNAAYGAVKVGQKSLPKLLVQTKQMGSQALAQGTQLASEGLAQGRQVGSKALAQTQKLGSQAYNTMGLTAAALRGGSAAASAGSVTGLSPLEGFTDIDLASGNAVEDGKFVLVEEGDAPAEDGGLSRNAKIALGVGIGGAAVAAIGTGIYFATRKKAQPQAEADEGDGVTLTAEEAQEAIAEAEMELAAIRKKKAIAKGVTIGSGVVAALLLGGGAVIRGTKLYESYRQGKLPPEDILSLEGEGEQQSLLAAENATPESAAEKGRKASFSPSEDVPDEQSAMGIYAPLSESIAQEEKSTVQQVWQKARDNEKVFWIAGVGMLVPTGVAAWKWRDYLLQEQGLINKIRSIKDAQRTLEELAEELKMKHTQLNDMKNDAGNFSLQDLNKAYTEYSQINHKYLIALGFKFKVSIENEAKPVESVTQKVAETQEIPTSAKKIDGGSLATSNVSTTSKRIEERKSVPLMGLGRQHSESHGNPLHQIQSVSRTDNDDYPNLEKYLLYDQMREQCIESMHTEGLGATTQLNLMKSKAQTIKDANPSASGYVRGRPGNKQVSGQVTRIQTNLSNDQWEDLAKLLDMKSNYLTQEIIDCYKNYNEHIVTQNSATERSAAINSQIERFTAPAEIEREQLTKAVAKEFAKINIDTAYLYPKIFIQEWIEEQIDASELSSSDKFKFNAQTPIEIEYYERDITSIPSDHMTAGKSSPAKRKEFTLEEIVTGEHLRFINGDLNYSTIGDPVKWPVAFTLDLKTKFKDVNLEKIYLTKAEAHFRRSEVSDIWKLSIEGRLHKEVKKYKNNKNNPFEFRNIATNFLDGTYSARIPKFEGVELSESVFLTNSNSQDDSGKGLLVFLNNDGTNVTYEIPEGKQQRVALSESTDERRKMVETNEELQKHVKEHLRLFNSKNLTTDSFKYRFGSYASGQALGTGTDYYDIPLTFKDRSAKIDAKLFDIFVDRLRSDIDTLVKTKGEITEDSLMELAKYLIGGMAMASGGLAFAGAPLILAAGLGVLFTGAELAVTLTQAQRADRVEDRDAYLTEAFFSLAGEVALPAIFKIVGAAFAGGKAVVKAGGRKLIKNEKFAKFLTDYFVQSKPTFGAMPGKGDVTNSFFSDPALYRGKQQGTVNILKEVISTTTSPAQLTKEMEGGWSGVYRLEELGGQISKEERRALAVTTSPTNYRNFIGVRPTIINSLGILAWVPAGLRLAVVDVGTDRMLYSMKSLGRGKAALRNESKGEWSRVNLAEQFESANGKIVLKNPADANAPKKEVSILMRSDEQRAQFPSGGVGQRRRMDAPNRSSPDASLAQVPQIDQDTRLMRATTEELFDEQTYEPIMNAKGQIEKRNYRQGFRSTNQVSAERAVKIDMDMAEEKIEILAYGKKDLGADLTGHPNITTLYNDYSTGLDTAIAENTAVLNALHPTPSPDVETQFFDMLNLEKKAGESDDVFLAVKNKAKNDYIEMLDAVKTNLLRHKRSDLDELWIVRGSGENARTYYKEGARRVFVDIDSETGVDSRLVWSHETSHFTHDTKDYYYFRDTKSPITNVIENLESNLPNQLSPEGIADVIDAKLGSGSFTEDVVAGKLGLQNLSSLRRTEPLRTVGGGIDKPIGSIDKDLLQMQLAKRPKSQRDELGTLIISVVKEDRDLKIPFMLKNADTFAHITRTLGGKLNAPARSRNRRDASQPSPMVGFWLSWAALPPQK